MLLKPRPEMPRTQHLKLLMWLMHVSGDVASCQLHQILSAPYLLNQM